MKLHFLPICIGTSLLFILPLQAGQASPGIAARVNGHEITMAELDHQVEHDFRGKPQTPQGVREQKQRLLNAMISRELIIQSFYKAGGKIPDAQIDASLDAIIKEEFGGDRAAFDQILQDRGVTLATYRREIADNFIVDYMKTRNVTDKIPQDMTDPQARAQQVQLLSDAWSSSLRKDAAIKIYLP